MRLSFLDDPAAWAEVLMALRGTVQPISYRGFSHVYHLGRITLASCDRDDAGSQSMYNVKTLVDYVVSYTATNLDVV
jgi:hypothetical protein